MKKVFLKMCVFLAFIIFAPVTHAGDADCECYMEYQDLETEARVYADEESKEAILTEFTPNQKLDIQQATTLLADVGESLADE